MKKLSKAQEKALEYIKRKSTPERVAESRKWYEEQLQNETRDSWIAWYRNHIQMLDTGWVLVNSLNSRTFEVLVREGYIEYIKDSIRGTHPIDWVRLKEDRI